MKRFYFLFLLCVFNILNAQNIVFEDTEFKNYLLSASQDVSIAQNASLEYIAIDTNGDGEISLTEAGEVYRLVIDLIANSNPPSITSLDGITQFASLRFLSVRGLNSLQTMDISFMPNLLDISIESNATLSSIFLNQNPLLQHSQFYTNPVLTSVNILSNPVLNSVFLNQCPVNSAIITDNPALNNLHIYDTVLNELSLEGSYGLLNIQMNFIDQLETLDLGSFENLQVILLDNMPSLSNIVFSENSSEVTQLTLSHLPNITELDVTPLEHLIMLDILDLPQLQTLNLENQEEMSWVRIYQTPNLHYVNLKNGNSTELLFTETEVSDQSLSYVCVDENEMVRFQTQYPQINFNSYCSFVPGGTFYEISGNALYDMNNDSCNPETSTPVSGLRLQLINTETYDAFFTNSEGSYFIPVQSGQHNVTPIFQNDYFDAQPNSFSVNFPDQPSPFHQNMCISANGIYNDLEIKLIPVSVASPGFEAIYKLIYKNKGSTVLSGSVDLQYDEDYMDLISASPVQNSASFNHLFWNFTDLLPFESGEIMLTYSLNPPTSPSYPLNDGDELSFTAKVNPVDSDETPLDNVFTLNQTVVNSFEPNDKTCLEGSSVSPEMVGEFVHYKIRFENTGSAEAVNIVVKDVINTEMFDIASLQPVDASHNFETRIKNGNEVEFIYENIMLPFDDANNDGYVVFKIKTLETLQLGDSFENDAEIYFDFNFPIVTNNAVTTIETLSTTDFALDEVEVKLYPNPVVSELNIQTESAIQSVQIYDVNGKLISQTSFTGTRQEVEIQADQLKSGIYFASVKTEKGIFKQKFLKK